MRFFALLSLALTFAVVTPAWGFVAEFNVDFYKGKIEIKPKPMFVTDHHVGYYKSSGFGLRLGGFRLNRQQKSKGWNDTYIFLTGNPDDLAVTVVSWACQGPYLLGVNALTHKFEVLKGKYSIRGDFALNRQIVANVLVNSHPETALLLNGLSEFLRGKVPSGGPFPAEEPYDFVNHACSEDFKAEYKDNNWRSFDSSGDSIFSVNINQRKKKATIAWDAKNWEDEIEQKTQKLIERGERLLSKPIGN